MQELEEKTLGHYSILHRLARGGMSHVYLACDQHTQRTVAIKVVHQSEDDYFIRFQREVKILSVLTHEHILSLIESGFEGSWYYCVMPYIEAGTLRKRLAEGPLTQEEAGAILKQVASALQFAHEHGILHRDIKPSNILLGPDGHVYLADFGLAKEIKEDSGVTQAGCLIGTPEYMAPELAEGLATTSSDIYALGILLYQMLTGRVPFKGGAPLSIYWRHIKEQPIPPSRINPAISYPVEQVVLHALQKEPRRRFTSVQAMAQAYERALHNSDRMQAAHLQDTWTLNPITLAPPTQRVVPAPMLARNSRRHVHPAFAALVAVFLVLVPLALGFSVSKDGLTSQGLVALGASAQFAQINGTLHKVSPHKPILSNLPTQSQQRNGGQKHKLGHKHGRGHGK